MNKAYTIVENNIPKTYYTCNGEDVIDDKLFTELPKAEQKTVLNWIKESFVSKSKAYNDIGAAKFKDIPQEKFGIYMTHNQFKHAMLIAGFKPVHMEDYDWFFRISTKSTAIRYFMSW